MAKLNDRSMFLLLYDYHIVGHQRGTSIQSCINLGETFFEERANESPHRYKLGKVFYITILRIPASWIYLLNIYDFYFWWHDTANQPLGNTVYAVFCLTITCFSVNYTLLHAQVSLNSIAAAATAKDIPWRTKHSYKCNRNMASIPLMASRRIHIATLPTSSPSVWLSTSRGKWEKLSMQDIYGFGALIMAWGQQG